MSVTSCPATWELAGYGDEGPLVLAVTEADCPRLPSQRGVTVPLVSGGGELSQILLDLRTLHAVEWTQAALLYDSSVGKYSCCFYSSYIVCISTYLS